MFTACLIAASAAVPLALLCVCSGARRSTAGLLAVAAAAVIAAIFFGGGERVNLSHLAVEEPAPPAQIGDFSVQAYVLDADAPDGREAVYFGEEYAENPPRLYDDENEGLRVEVLRGTEPYNGAVEVRHPAIRDGQVTEEILTVDVVDGVGEWQGQPLVGSTPGGSSPNRLTVTLPQQAFAASDGDRFVLAADAFNHGGFPLQSLEATSAEATLHVFSRYGSGSIRDNVIETRTEMAEVLTSDAPSDQLVQRAVQESCGLNPGDIADVVIRENDQPRYQAGLAPGGEHMFVASNVVVPAGQQVWALMDKDGKECVVNPPCGNPPPPPSPPPPTAIPTPTLTPTPKPGKGQLKVIKYWDKNQNCSQDGDEPYLSGFNFEVIGPESWTFTIDTDPDLFTVESGTYTVKEVNIPDGWWLSSCEVDTKMALVEVGEPPAEVRFGNVQVKVQPSPTPTPTGTPSTATVTNTPTPTPTGTVATSTPTPTGTVPTSTPTPTGTVPTSTPTPTNTPVTPTVTNTPVTPTSTPVTPTVTNTPVSSCLVTILGPHRLDNDGNQSRLQASVQWDIRPNFTSTTRWFLDSADNFIGGGEQVAFTADLGLPHVLFVKVFKEGSLVCHTSTDDFPEGSATPGPGNTPAPTPTARPAPSPTTNPDDGYQGP